jgi:parvulin-like peptidyl-prolyl isomerase
MKDMRIKSAVIVLIAIGMLSGCGEWKPERPTAESKRVSSLSDRAPGHHGLLGDGSTKSLLSPEEAAVVVARVGDIGITLGEYEARLNDQPAYVRVRYNSLEKKKEFLDNLVRFELLAYEARQKGYDQAPDVVFALKQRMIKKLLETDLENLVSMSDVSDVDVAGYYEDNQASYNKPEQVRSSQIVFASEADASMALQELQTKFQENARRRKQLFMEAVKAHSTDEVSRKTHGDLGFFTRDGDVEKGRAPVTSQVLEAAFALTRINELSPVVPDGDAFYILMLTNRRPEVVKTLDDVKRQIRNKLFRERKSAAREKYVAELRMRAGVSVDESKLTLVKDPKLEVPMPERKALPGMSEIDAMRGDLEKKGIPTRPNAAGGDGATP